MSLSAPAPKFGDPHASLQFRRATIQTASEEAPSPINDKRRELIFAALSVIDPDDLKIMVLKIMDDAKDGCLKSQRTILELIGRPDQGEVMDRLRALEKRMSA